MDEKQEQGLVLVERSSNAVAAIAMQVAGLPIKQAVSLLENLAPGEIREYLVASGLIENFPKLREVVEASLTFTGGEEHSSVIAALMPEEISAIIQISPEIFSQEASDLICPSDYDDPAKWERLTREEFEVIMISGDKRVIRRLINFHSEPWTQKGRAEGPWGLFREDVRIFPETVAAYFSAICNSPNSEEWKEQAVRALGVELLAYSVGFAPGMFQACLEHFPEVAKNIATLREVGMSREDALASYREAMERLERDLGAKGIQLPKDDLASLLAELRDVGITNPTADEVKGAIEAQVALDAAFKEGIPE